MAMTLPKNAEPKGDHVGNGYMSKFNNSDEHENNESDKDSDSPDTLKQSVLEYPRVAIGYDDRCVQIYAISDADEFIYIKSLPRVKGHEVYRITAGLGGLGSGHELCIWSLLSLRSGTLVSADSSGSVQLWDN